MQDADDQRHQGDADAAGNGGLQARLVRLLGGRPLSVYGVLLAGVGVLVLLLAIVVITARGDDAGQGAFECLDVTLQEAEAAITHGDVERITVVSPTDKPETGPIKVSMRLNDGYCRQLPQGAVSQPDLYYIIGVVDYYNQSREGEQRISLRYERQPNIPKELLATATPTATALPTTTPAPTATLAPTPTRTPRPPTPTPPPPTPTPTVAAPRSTPVPTRAPVAPPSPTPRPSATRAP